MAEDSKGSRRSNGNVTLETLANLATAAATERGARFRVRAPLLELSKADRRIVGVGLKDLEFGWPIGMPLCRALGGGLFELRVSLRSRRIARVIVCVHDEELFALHGFIKKTQKTPDGDLKLARSRKRQLEKTR